MKAYFAMPTTYFDDPGLEEDVEILKLAGYDPYVPNSEEDEIGYKAKGMDYFRELIKKSNFKILFFRPFANHRIGQGVANEIETAMNLNIPVCEMVTGDKPKLFYRYQMGVRELTIAETRATLKTIRECERLDGLGNLIDVD